MSTDTREALAAARSALGQLIEAGKAVKAALDAAIPDGEPVHPESRRLTWPISSGLLALDAVDAALATQPAAQPSAQGEAVAWLYPHGGYYKVAQCHPPPEDSFPVYRALASAPAAPAQPSAQGEAVLDRESTWWSLAMGAAASLEDAANCMRDEDAERAALGAAAHVRKQCAMLTSAPAAPAQFVAHELSPSKERAALASVVFQGLTHDERLVPSEALRASLLGAKLLLRGEPAQPSDSTGAMAAAWFGTPGTERAVNAVFGPKGAQPSAQAVDMRTMIAAAWVAGYYHAGYTNDSAYADKMSDEYADEAFAASPHPQPSAQGEAVADKYGSTDFGYTFAGIPVSEGGKRLMSMLVRAFGTDHPAVDDLTSLLFAAASAPAAPAQAVPLTPLRDGEIALLTSAVLLTDYDTLADYDIAVIRAYESARGIAPKTSQEPKT